MVERASQIVSEQIKKKNAEDIEIGRKRDQKLREKLERSSQLPNNVPSSQLTTRSMAKVKKPAM